jgi:hypothetical protein
LTREDRKAGGLPPALFHRRASRQKEFDSERFGARSESDIRINFWNPNKVIAASNHIETSGIQAQFYSTDGGATWGSPSSTW